MRALLVLSALLAGCFGPSAGGIYFSHQGLDADSLPVRDGYVEQPGPIRVIGYNRSSEDARCEWSSDRDQCVDDMQAGGSLRFKSSCDLVVLCRDDEGDELFLMVFLSDCEP